MRIIKLFERAPLSTLGIALLVAVLWPLSSQASQPVDIEVFLETGSCPGCDLSGLILENVAAGDNDFSSANLSDASLYGANLSQANLSGADLNGADLTRAFLTGADLSDVSLHSADLTGATMALADTTGAFSDESTTCPDGTAGPCDFLEVN